MRTLRPSTSSFTCTPRQLRMIWRLASVALGVFVVACSPKAPQTGSQPGSGDPTPATQSGDSQLTDVDVTTLVPCGTLSPEQAATLSVGHAREVLLSALHRSAFLDDSTTLTALARGLSGDASEGGILNVPERERQVESFLDDLAQRYLTSENLEQTDDATVTYLLRPETLCTPPTDEQGAPLAERQREHEDCLNTYATPRRLELSRVRCDIASDQLLLRVLVGEQRRSIAAALLEPRALQLSVQLPDFIETLVELNESETEVLEASGELRLRLALGGPIAPSVHLKQLGAAGSGASVAQAPQAADAVHLSLSIPRPIALSLRSDSDHLQVELPASPDASRLELDAAARDATWSASIAELALVQDLGSFVQTAFDRALTEPSTREVSTRLPRFEGSLRYSASDDRLVGVGLEFAGRAVSSEQGTELLGITAAGRSGAAVDFEISSDANTDLRLSVPSGFALAIDYAMQRVASQVADLQQFVLDDQVNVRAASDTLVTLPQDPESLVFKLLELSPGPVLGVEAGELSFTSRRVPEADVRVEPEQCLHQLSSHAAPHEMFGDMSSDSCE